MLDSILTIYEHENAIVLFVADHGEEAFDELPIQGRLFQEPTPQQAHYEFEVPMWIWCSECYRQNHPTVIKNLMLAQDKPFLTDAIPQILLSLADISCRWKNVTRNLLSPTYHSKRRIIVGNVDYDELFSNQ